MSEKTCYKELAINTGKPLKNVATSNISKNSAIFFLPILKTSISQSTSKSQNGHFWKCNKLFCITPIRTIYIYYIYMYVYVYICIYMYIYGIWYIGI